MFNAVQVFVSKPVERCESEKQLESEDYRNPAASPCLSFDTGIAAGECHIRLSIFYSSFSIAGVVGEPCDAKSAITEL